MKLNSTMNAAIPPILLTSCIYIADNAVNLTDPDDRIFYTLESIEKWLSIVPDAKLIVCDSSGFDFSTLVHEKFPHANIECLYFVADKNLVKYHGKGYGEGEIIKYAVENSSYLKQADYFAKCTAKLWVENFDECINEWNGTFLCKAIFSNVFSFKKTFFDHIDTRFYLVNKAFYLKHLVTAHLDLGGSSGLSIEDRFREIILENKMTGVLFNIHPVIGGVGGGTGKYYNIKHYKKLKEILRLQFVKFNPVFKPLFNHVQ